ncbi:hypothetical protein BgiMline_000109, partial [Biomphalaria glabrata]
MLGDPLMTVKCLQKGRHQDCHRNVVSWLQGGTAADWMFIYVEIFLKKREEKK